MYKYLALLVSAILCCVQCLPLNATHSESTSSSQMHLIMNNSSQSTNYHITPVASVLEDIDKEIDDQLKAILPYLNFFFDSLLGPSKPDNDDDCINDMVIELVPDETARPPASPAADDQLQPEDKPEPQPEPQPDQPAEGKSDDKSAAKPTPQAGVVSAPENPAEKVETNP